MLSSASTFTQCNQIPQCCTICMYYIRVIGCCILVACLVCEQSPVWLFVHRFLFGDYIFQLKDIKKQTKKASRNSCSSIWATMSMTTGAACMRALIYIPLIYMRRACYRTHRALMICRCSCTRGAVNQSRAMRLNHIDTI